MRRLALLSALVTLLVYGCGRSKNGGDDGTPTPTATPTPTPVACATSGTDLVFLLDDTYQLISFDPSLIATDPYEVIGTPDCVPGTAIAPYTDPATPFSMAIDKNGDAWILYTSGELFRVSTDDATCSDIAFTPQQNAGGMTWSLFGTAFASDTSGSEDERLWISGGPADGSLGSLGVVDPAVLTVSRIGAIGGAAPNRPELMGLSDSTLWGFFPDSGAGFVQQIDKTNGTLLGSPAPIEVGKESLVSWGAAHHGGTFWLFVTTYDGLANNATIQTIERADGTYALVLQNQPHVVVAAASSICAPL